jgi:hypothetical protein
MILAAYAFIDIRFRGSLLKASHAGVLAICHYPIVAREQAHHSCMNNIKKLEQVGVIAGISLDC